MNCEALPRATQGIEPAKLSYQVFRRIKGSLVTWTVIGDPASPVGNQEATLQGDRLVWSPDPRHERRFIVRQEERVRNDPAHYLNPGWDGGASNVSKVEQATYALNGTTASSPASTAGKPQAKKKAKKKSQWSEKWALSSLTLSSWDWFILVSTNMTNLRSWKCLCFSQTFLGIGREKKDWMSLERFSGFETKPSCSTV